MVLKQFLWRRPGSAWFRYSSFIHTQIFGRTAARWFWTFDQEARDAEITRRRRTAVESFLRVPSGSVQKKVKCRSMWLSAAVLLQVCMSRKNLHLGENKSTDSQQIWENRRWYFKIAKLTKCNNREQDYNSGIRPSQDFSGSLVSLSISDTWRSVWIRGCGRGSRCSPFIAFVQ